MDEIGALHIEGDKFVNKYEEPPPYSRCLRQLEFDAAIDRAVATGRIVILDAVCLDEVAPIDRWGRGYIVYVKRLSFNNQDPMWHRGYELEGEAPTDEIHRSVYLYHSRVRPHETADLIVEMPEEGHKITHSKFSREYCFDPPNTNGK